MKQWNSRRLTVLVVLAFAVVSLAVLAAPAAAQYPNGRLSEPADVMLLAGHGVTLGVTVRDADNPDTQPGVVVEDLVSGGAADRAGLRRGDVITAFGGEQVHSARQFTRLVDEAVLGRAVRATFVRDGRKTDVSLTPVASERPVTITIDPERLRERAREMLPMVEMDMDLPGARARIGVTIQEMTPQLAGYFGARQGVLVSSVSDNSPASRAGLKAGDVIVSVDGRAVATRTDLLGFLREAGDRQDVSIGIMRDRRETTVKATVERDRRETRQYFGRGI